jgi:hypothetical protein
MSFDNNTSAEVIDPEMPYGKHAGTPLSGVPTQYLRWMYADWNFRYYPELQRAVERRLGLPPDPSIRTGVVKDPAGKPAGGPNLPYSGRPNGYSPGAGCTRETGLDAFRRAFDRARREALAEFEAEPEIAGLLADTLDKVRTALGI